MRNSAIGYLSLHKIRRYLICCCTIKMVGNTRAVQHLFSALPTGIPGGQRDISCEAKIMTIVEANVKANNTEAGEANVEANTENTRAGRHPLAALPNLSILC